MLHVYPNFKRNQRKYGKKCYILCSIWLLFSGSFVILFQLWVYLHCLPIHFWYPFDLAKAYCQCFVFKLNKRFSAQKILTVLLQWGLKFYKEVKDTKKKTPTVLYKKAKSIAQTHLTNGIQLSYSQIGRCISLCFNDSRGEIQSLTTLCEHIKTNIIG